MLRAARPSDAGAIGDIFVAASRQSLQYLPRLYHTDEETRTWIREIVLPTTTVWVAESGGQVAGFCSLKQQKLQHLYVRPGFQSRGIGTALLEQARALSPSRLELYTFARNEGARRFYERHGFRPIAVGQDNEEKEPDVHYEWMPERSETTT